MREDPEGLGDGGVGRVGFGVRRVGGRECRQSAVAQLRCPPSQQLLLVCLPACWVSRLLDTCVASGTPSSLCVSQALCVCLSAASRCLENDHIWKLRTPCGVPDAEECLDWWQFNAYNTL